MRGMCVSRRSRRVPGDVSVDETTPMHYKGMRSGTREVYCYEIYFSKNPPRNEAYFPEMQAMGIASISATSYE